MQNNILPVVFEKHNFARILGVFLARFSNANVALVANLNKTNRDNSWRRQDREVISSVYRESEREKRILLIPV